MSNKTYHLPRNSKPLAWLAGEIKSPPFSVAARVEIGFLLRKVQQGERLSFPHSRPMPEIGIRCHELRIRNARVSWRILYGIEPDAIVILDVHEKKTKKTPRVVIDRCRRRLADYHFA